MTQTQDRFELALLAVMSTAVLFIGAASSELHGTAVLYASMAREMADSGNPLAPYVAEVPYFLKPPLAMWLTAIAIKLFDPSNFSATLVSRLFGVAAVLLTFFIGRRLFTRPVAWMACLFLVTNSTFHQFSTAFRMDSLLTFGMLLSVLAYLYPRRAWSGAGFFGGAAFATLSKGPLGLAPLLILPMHSLLARRPLPVKKWLPWTLLLLLPAAWYGCLYVLHGSLPFTELGADVVRGHERSLVENATAAMNEYLFKPARRFWPWLPFMVAGLVIGVIKMFTTQRRKERFALSLLLWWTFAVLVGAFLKPDPDIRYLYPALPALCMLAAWFIEQILRFRPSLRIRIATACLLTAFAFSASAAGWFTTDTREAIADIKRIVDSRYPNGEALTVIAEHGPHPADQPRIQREAYDWVYFYLGRDAIVFHQLSVKPEDVADAELVLVSRFPDQKALMKKFNLRPVVSASEIALTERDGQIVANE